MEEDRVQEVTPPATGMLKHDVCAPRMVYSDHSCLHTEPSVLKGPAQPVFSTLKAIAFFIFFIPLERFCLSVSQIVY